VTSTDIPVRASAVSVIVLRPAPNGKYQVLLLKRRNKPVGEWCQVIGSLEPGETAWQGALREMHEETGLVPKKFYSANTHEQFYDAASDQMLIVPVFVAYVEPDTRIELNDEHSDYAWLNFGAARNRVPFSGQRRVLKFVKRNFVERAANAHLLISDNR